MTGNARQLVSQADELANQIRSVAEQSADKDAQRLSNDLLIVLAALKNRVTEPKPMRRVNPSGDTIRPTLMLNPATIELIEYLRSSQVVAPLYRGIDICDENIDWHAAARFATRAGVPQPHSNSSRDRANSNHALSR